VIYDTEIFEFTDFEKARKVFESYRGALDDLGAKDIQFLRHIDEPGKVLVAMWWPSVEACRAFNDKYGPEIMEKVGSITKSAEPDQLWEEVS
jgi:hypothetical protein